jgi:hypothetical protein
VLTPPPPIKSSNIVLYYEKVLFGLQIYLMITIYEETGPMPFMFDGTKLITSNDLKIIIHLGV